MKRFTILAALFVICLSLFASCSNTESDYEALYNELLAENNLLSEQKKSLENDYDDLEDDYKALKRKYNNLSADYNDLDDKYGNLSDDYNDLDSKYLNLQSDYSALQKKNKNNKPQSSYSTTYTTVSANAGTTYTPTYTTTYTPTYTTNYTADYGYNVVITKTGEKYHTSTCRYVKGKTNTSTLSLSTAKARGYTACKVCKP